MNEKINVLGSKSNKMEFVSEERRRGKEREIM
jgi:hypothetical protein